MTKMERIIIRRDVIPALNSKVNLMGYNSYTIPITSLDGADELLSRAVAEGVPFETLLHEYRKTVASSESPLFAKMYWISETSGLVIDQNIYLYHCDPCPVWITYGEHKWAYMSSRKYLGDSWWFDDKEILEDIQEMNTVEFLEKYKGY